MSTEPYPENRLRQFEGIEALKLECLIQAENFPEEEKALKSFGIALNRALFDPEVRDLVAFTIERRPDISPAYRFNIMQRSFQKLFWRESVKFGYPDKFDDPEYCYSMVMSVLVPDADDPNSAEQELMREEWLSDMLSQNIQSNVAERYKSFRLFLLSQMGRLGPNPSVLDVGCSQNQGLKKIVLNRPFARTLAGYSAQFSANGREATLEVDRRLTANANALLRRPVSLGDCLGVDIVPIGFQGIPEWAKSCSFRPSEIKNKGLIREYNRLDQAQADNVGFVEADFLQGLPRGFGNRKFQAVTFSFAKYQFDETARTQLLDRAKECVDPNGFILVLEPAKVDPTNPGRMDYEQRFFDRPFAIRMAAMDMADGDGKFEEIFRWNHGRCKELLLGDLSVTGALTEQAHQYLATDAVG